MIVKKAVYLFLTLTLTIGLSFSAALAEDKADTAFYQECIMNKALMCEQKAQTISKASGKELMAEATAARSQAAFYRDCQEVLAERLAAGHVSGQRHCVEHYLIKAYHDQALRQEIAEAARARMARHIDVQSGPVTQ